MAFPVFLSPLLARPPGARRTYHSAGGSKGSLGKGVKGLETRELLEGSGVGAESATATERSGGTRNESHSSAGNCGGGARHRSHRAHGGSGGEGGGDHDDDRPMDSFPEWNWRMNVNLEATATTI